MTTAWVEEQQGKEGAQEEEGERRELRGCQNEGERGV